MKRLWTMLLVLTMILFVLSGCGGEQPGAAVEEPEAPTLQLSLDQWPVVDGATAFSPYYETMAAKVLNMPVEEAREYVLCSTTDYAYPSLADGTVDMIFCLLPSEDQIAYAAEKGVTFENVPILNEGFVFFVNQDNPVDSITVEQLHDIYAGEITNWSELGGSDVDIIAYQRSEGSGSQTGLYTYIIPQEEVMEAPTEKRIGDMAGIIDAVAFYDNAEGALGYSYYYFVSNMHYDENIKLLQIEGVEPNKETISSKEYPLISQAQVVFRSDEPSDSVVRQIADWCISEQGQQLGEELGYVRSIQKSE